MSFQPHPAQQQALRTAKRFREGFRPTTVNDEVLPPNSALGPLSFSEVPLQVLFAETGHLCTSGECDRLLRDLCNRGYLTKHEEYPKCRWAPMEYQTEDGAKVFVHDKDWSEIAVLRPAAVQPNGKDSVRHYLSGTQAHIVLKSKAAAGGEIPPKKRTTPARDSNRSQKRDEAGPGSCYELLPEGYKLLDLLDHGEEAGPSKRNQKRPAWKRLVLHRSSDGSDHHADLDGKTIRIRGDAAYDMMQVLQEKKGERVKAASLQSVINQRPDRVLKRLDKKLQRIIDPPNKGIGYAML